MENIARGESGRVDLSASFSGVERVFRRIFHMQRDPRMGRKNTPEGGPNWLTLSSNKYVELRRKWIYDVDAGIKSQIGLSADFSWIFLTRNFRISVAFFGDKRFEIIFVVDIFFLLLEFSFIICLSHIWVWNRRLTLCWAYS